MMGSSFAISLPSGSLLFSRSGKYSTSRGKSTRVNYPYHGAFYPFLSYALCFVRFWACSRYVVHKAEDKDRDGTGDGNGFHGTSRNAKQRKNKMTSYFGATNRNWETVCFNEIH